MNDVVAIIPAAGSGKRMSGAVNKPFLEIGGQSILERTLLAFENARRITRIILIGKADETDQLKALVQACAVHKVEVVVVGGKERQDSIYNALAHTKASDKWVLVHDGARPFVTSDMIDDMVDALEQMDPKEAALILAVPAKDTIKFVEGASVQKTLDRSKLWQVQTPQGFSRTVLLEAYEKARREGHTGTDDASLVEWMGRVVHVKMGRYENIKITTPDDLYIGEAILRKRGEMGCE